MIRNPTAVSYSDWTAVRSALVADVLRKNATLPQLVRLCVYGESMLPALWPGDFVEIESCSPEDARPGEIVLAMRDGQLFLHRLLSPCTPEGFKLRGDSLPHPDPQFPREALLGRQVRRNGVRRAHRAGSVTTSAMPLGIRPTLSRAIGLLLCHCAPARRAALKLHSLRRAWARELGDARAGAEHSSSGLTPAEPRAT
jgi:Peptidase S24-like